MADGSDGPDVSAGGGGGGEIWGTLEELLLAFAVCRHGTASWDSVAAEVQTRSPLAARPRLTPGSCRLRFRQLHRRFSVGEAEVEAGAEGEAGPEASAAGGWLDELRRLRVAELRREVERCDLSIGTLQSKVELMKEERERSQSGDAKPEGAAGEENMSSEEPGRSCRESNSTDLKRPSGAGAKAEGEEQEEEEAAAGAKQELSGESKESAVSLQCRRRKVEGGADEEPDEPLAALLDRVAARFGPVFDQLQESLESESYRGTIRRHVDLEAMRRKLDGAPGYQTSAELYRDLLLLCANAAVYLPRHAPDHAAAALNALRLVSAQVSASLRQQQPPHKLEPPNGADPPPPAPPVVDSRRADTDLVGPLIEKAAKPLIFCRKRSSIAKSAAAAAVARKEEAAGKREVIKEDVESDGEKNAAVAAAKSSSKAWGTGMKKTRGPGKNSRKAIAAAAEEAAREAGKKDGDSDGAAACGLPKKRIAVDFLKRLNQGKSSSSSPKKRGSPLTKRKRSAPARDDEEEEPPKARKGPGRKNTGRGGSKAGAATKRSVGRPPQKRGAAPATPPPSKRAKVSRTERSSSSSRRGGRK